MCGCCGTPDFEELIGYNIAYSKYKYGKWKDVTDSSGKSAINSILRDNNPISKIDNFIDVDMFFMIGEDDTTLPNDVSKSFIYDHIVGNNSQVKIYKQEHEFTDNNYNDMLDYFIQYLN
jgi:esterase/lipase